MTVDTPTPYTLAELNDQLDGEMGRLDNQPSLGPLQKLKGRLAAVQSDPRYGFMFPSEIFLIGDLAAILGQLFRVPADGRPICRLDFSEISSEILNVVAAVVVVAVVGRLAFSPRRAGRHRRPAQELGQVGGPDDQVGTLNYTTADDIVRAAGLVRKGQVISLALNYDKDGPQGGKTKFPPVGRFNVVSAELDRARIRWSAEDMTENRPALSRWHPDVIADRGTRLGGTAPPRQPRVVACAALALCLHAAVLVLLVTWQPPDAPPEKLHETTVEIMTLPPAPVTESVVPAPADRPAPPEPVSSSAVAEAVVPRPTPDQPPDPTPIVPPLVAPPLVASSEIVPAEPSAAPVAMGAIVAPMRAPPHPTPIKPRLRPAADPAPSRPAPPAVEPMAGASAAPSALPPARAPSVDRAPADGAAEAAFAARMRQAVQDALRYPAAARMMGVTGRSRLELDYRAGSLTGVSLVQSAGRQLLDDAAAARSAHYPAPPPDFADRKMRFLIWVSFTVG